MPNENARSDRYLIRKGAYFYRPNCCGYTVNKDEAGRYTRAEAEIYTHPNGPDGPSDDMSYVHEDDVPDTQAQQRERAAAAAAWLAARNTCTDWSALLPDNASQHECDAVRRYVAVLRALPPPADAMAALAEVVRKAKEEEREACAVIADETDTGWFDARTFTAQKIAAAIRARGEGGE